MTANLNKNKVLEGAPLVILVCCVGIFALLRAAEHQVRLPWWASGYLDDLIALPLILGIVLVAHRFWNKSPGYLLPAGHQWVAFLLICLYFEVLMPGLKSGFTADPWDVAVYGAGLFVFQLGVNRPAGLSGRPRRA